MPPKTKSPTKPKRNKRTAAPAWNWALPDEVDVPPDRLMARLDFYSETVLLHLHHGPQVTTRVVSAMDIASALTRELPLFSGILPDGALWWSSNADGPSIALWRPAQVWKVALQLEAFKPAERYEVPMPGLVFLCQPGRPPSVYAAKRRPRTQDEQLYHAPLFNVFRGGLTCQGTQQYGADVSRIPEEFFLSFFSHAGDLHGRSKKYPNDLLQWWQELDGRKRYPHGDLVPVCTVKDLIAKREHHQ